MPSASPPARPRRTIRPHSSSLDTASRPSGVLAHQLNILDPASLMETTFVGPALLAWASECRPATTATCRCGRAAKAAATPRRRRPPFALAEASEHSSGDADSIGDLRDAVAYRNKYSRASVEDSIEVGADRGDQRSDHSDTTARTPPLTYQSTSGNGPGDSDSTDQAKARNSSGLNQWRGRTGDDTLLHDGNGYFVDNQLQSRSSQAARGSPEGSATRELNTGLSALYRRGKYSTALKTFRTALDLHRDGRGPAPDIVTFNIALSVFGKMGHITKSMDLLPEMKALGIEPDHISFSTLIHHCGKNGEVDTTFWVFNEMKKRDLQPNTLACNTLIASALRSGKLEDAIRVLDTMRDSGLAPDAVTFSSLIDGLGKAGRIEQAFQMKGAMENAGLEPNEFTYNSLLDACGRARQVDRAFSVFEQMRSAGVNPDRITYSTLISVCGAAGELRLAFKVFDEMKREGIPRDQVTYGVIIEACGKARRLERAFQLLKEMKEENIPRGRVVYSSLIAACGKSGDLETAFEVFEEMVEENVEANEIIYSALIDACGKARDPERAFRIFQHMKEIGIDPNAVTYNGLMNACSSTGNLRAAFEVYDMMLADSVRPDNYTHNVLMTACGNNGELDLAFGVFEEMQRCGMRPDQVSYNCLISSCANVGDMKRAFEVFEAMIQDGINGTTISFNALLQVSAKNKKIDIAESILRRMRKAKMVYADRTTYRILLEMYSKASMEAKALEVLEQSLSEGCTRMDNAIAIAIREFAVQGKSGVSSRIARLAAENGKSLSLNQINTLARQFADKGAIRDSVEMLWAARQSNTFIEPRTLTAVERKLRQSSHFQNQRVNLREELENRMQAFQKRQSA